MLSVLLGLAIVTGAEERQPNILFLLSDDQAWNGLSCAMHPDMPGSKNQYVQTPNIAKLASQGMRFSAAYSPASVCAPTRISLQTGKSPARCQWTKAAPSMTAEDGFRLIPPQNRRSIELEEVTIGELLQSAGYSTAHYGKWHIGGGGPESHGYDESDGNTGNRDAEPHVEPNPVDIFGMGKRAESFMEKNTKAGKPFFIQMSYHALHYPENATKSLVQKYRELIPRGNEKEIGRAAIAEDLDRGVGELLEKIDQLEIGDNTYVIYMSDNGSSTKNLLRGGKGGVWEGGIRVPLIIRGPGIAADSWCHERVVGYDFFPTWCKMAGVKQALPSGIEGGLIDHLLAGKTDQVKRPREELVFHFPHYQGDAPHTAMFLGNYKLLRFYEDNSLRLYNTSDIAESKNLADQKPDVAKTMMEKMDGYLQLVNAQMPVPNSNYDPENPPGLKKKRGGKGGKKGRGNMKGGGGKREKKMERDGGVEASPSRTDAHRNEPGSEKRAPWILVHATEIDLNSDGVVEFENERNGDQKLTPEEYRVEGGFISRFPGKMKPQAESKPHGVSDPGKLPDTPNFVVFLIDDMGWNAMGFTGNDWIDTPRTDEMARSGMIFTQAYASAPNCAPTRACLMSGQYQPRHGIYTVVDDRHKPGLPHHKVLAAHSNAELVAESVTIAESLKSGGYATDMFGMWNLGRGRNGPVTPLGQGFDVFKQPRDLGFEKDRYFTDDGKYLTDVFTDGGIDFIKQNRTQPFFLYLAYHGIHSPFEPKPDLLRKYRDRGVDKPEYAATIEAVDQNVGRIVDALAANGLDDNTVVVFHSDNGGERRLMRPLRDGKGSVYEGGIRVPTAVWGAGIRQGTTSEPIVSMDIYPTLLDMADLESPAGHVLDGESLAPLLLGKSTKLNRDRLFWHFPCYIGGGGPVSAMRKGKWKIVENFETQSFELYDLSSDPGEENNLSSSNPEKLAQLKADLLDWQKETNAPRPIAANPNYDPSAKPIRGRENRGRKKGGKR